MYVQIYLYHINLLLHTYSWISSFGPAVNLHRCFRNDEFPPLQVFLGTNPKHISCLRPHAPLGARRINDDNDILRNVLPPSLQYDICQEFRAELSVACGRRRFSGRKYFYIQRLSYRVLEKTTKTKQKRNQFHQQYSLNDDLATKEITKSQHI